MINFEANILNLECASYPHLHKPYLVRNRDPWATFLPLTVWVYLHSNFCGGLERHGAYDYE